MVAAKANKKLSDNLNKHLTNNSNCILLKVLAQSYFCTNK